MFRAHSYQDLKHQFHSPDLPHVVFTIHCVFFFIHGLATKQRQMVRRTVTTKLEGMWKEAVKTSFKHYSGIFHERLSKSM
jgi:hypothetical protein